jgi:hypothetical protein
MIDDLHYIHERDSSDALGKAERTWRPVLTDSLSSWLPVVPTSQNLAKKIALDCIGKSVLLYSGEQFLPVIKVWKTSINSIAHQVAWCGELSQSEADGWQQPIDKLYAVVELRSTFDSDQDKRMYQTNERMLSGRRPAPIKLELQGSTLQEQLDWAGGLGNFVAVYMGILNGSKT